MKTIINILAILILISLNSCIKEYETTTYFYINNNSSYDIKMVVYNTDIALLGYNNDTTINLQVGENFNYFEIIKGENSPASFPFGASSDSVEIYINDSIIITYKQKLRYLDNNKNNILSIDSYNGKKEKEDLYKYYYSFSNEHLDSLLDKY